MYDMNLVQDICLIKNNINSISKIHFILRNKEIKKFNNKISEFMNLDIFNASDNMLTFLISLGKETTNAAIDCYLWYDNSCISIQLCDNDNMCPTYIDYYPNSNRFEIKSDHVSYSIYRNTKISNRINEMWGPLSINIKEKYVDIIIQIAEYISNKT